MGKAEKIKRMNDIRRRKQQRKRRRALMNILLLTAAVILIFAAVSCHNKKREEKLAVRNATPAPTAIEVTAVPSKKPARKNTGDYRDFFVNSAFVGNSFIDGMEIYELLDDAHYFAKVGLSVNDAMTEPAVNGVKPVIEELNGDKSYDKIFMMFGENEIGWAHSDTFAEQYAKLIRKAKKYQPEAEIYLLSITPISKTASEEAVDDATNEKIVEYNKLIKALAEDEDVVYCDIFKAVANSDGALPDEAASDGIHFTREYYEKCLKYISNNYGGTSSGEISDEDLPSSSETVPEESPGVSSKAANRL